MALSYRIDDVWSQDLRRPTAVLVVVVETGVERFTFGIPQLYDGFEFTTLAVGLYGIAEILKNLGLGPRRRFQARRRGSDRGYLWETRPARCGRSAWARAGLAAVGGAT